MIDTDTLDRLSAEGWEINRESELVTGRPAVEFVMRWNIDHRVVAQLDDVEAFVNDLDHSFIAMAGAVKRRHVHRPDDIDHVGDPNDDPGMRGFRP